MVQQKCTDLKIIGVLCHYSGPGPISMCANNVRPGEHEVLGSIQHYRKIYEMMDCADYNDAFSPLTY